MKGYGQFCPVARAAEILTERWTPLVIRELLCGSTRFGDLRRGLPLMSPSLLSQRLKTLQDAGVIQRRRSTSTRGWEYHLTRAGEELRPMVEVLGIWGQRWLEQELTGEELDPSLLMWDIQRRLEVDRMPEHRIVIRFEFASAPSARRRWWLVSERRSVDLCSRDPGHPVDLVLTTDVRTLTAVWLGQLGYPAARRSGRIALSGPRSLVQAFGSWLRLSLFAQVTPDAPLPEVLSAVTTPLPPRVESAPT